MQLIKDHEEVDAVNSQLEKMGFNIGIRVVDEFLAKSGIYILSEASTVDGSEGTMSREQ